MNLMKQCPRCHQYVDDNAQYCSKCGYAFTQPGTPPPPEGMYGDNAFDACTSDGKSRGIAALLAIFLGCIGAQYFYIGKTTAGILSIVLSLASCGIWSTVAFIQGILMLCMTNRQFREKYVDTPSTFPLF